MSETVADEEQASWILAVLGVDLAGPAEELDDDVALDDDGYRAYLLKKLRQVKQAGSASFAIAFGKRGKNHRMALHLNRAPKALAAGLVRGTHLRQATWGSVAPHPEKPVTLRITLDGRHVPGLCKKGGMMLRAFRPLPFAHMVLCVDGHDVADLEEEFPMDEDPADLPVSELPEPPQDITQQNQTLSRAAVQRAALCEECPA